MSKSKKEGSTEFYVQTYDEAVPDWPGEMDFYREFTAEVKRKKGSLLEIACGTGRVIIRLAQMGVKATGLDFSSEMLAAAKRKSAGMENIRWAKADMRTFELGEVFDLAIIPAHSFHNLVTAQDQADCLGCIRRHLKPGGRLILHLDYPDFAWYGSLMGDMAGVFDEEHKFKHPKSGALVRETKAWTFEPSTQSVTCRTKWVELDENIAVTSERFSETVRLHVIFPFEVEHLLKRTGYAIEATYGDFDRSPLTDKGPQMIWVAQVPG